MSSLTLTPRPGDNLKMFTPCTSCRKPADLDTLLLYIHRETHECVALCLDCQVKARQQRGKKVGKQ